MNGQGALEPAADQAAAIYDNWQLLFWICLVMGLLVAGGLAWAIWRTRRVSALRDVAPATGPTANEAPMIRWLTSWIVLMAVGLLVLTLGSYLVDRSLAREVGPPVKVKITGNQWWWQIEYDDPANPSQTFVTANELHLPLGRTADITLDSRDVIHSFWVPALNGKEDLIPGRENHILITPRQLGRFRGQCAEFCGLEHAKMILQVSVDRAADFERWRATQLQSAPPPPPGSVADQGLQVFLSKGCAMCHAIQGTGASARLGPDLTHVAGRRTIAAGALPMARGYLAAWIADPQSQKPGANMPAEPLSADELQSVVVYLETLK